MSEELKKPLVSFIASVRNKEAWIGEALKSLSDQTLKDFEAIYVDDASEDSTPRVLAHYAKMDPRYKVFTLPVHGGVGMALNEATKHVTSDIIIVASGDDVYMQERAQLHYDYFQKNPEIDVHYADFFLTDGALNPFRLKEAEPFVLDEYKKILPNGRANQTVPHGFSAYRTKVGRDVPYVETQQVGNDYPFFLSVGEKGFKFGHENLYKTTGKTLGFYRILPTSVSVVNAKKIQEQDRELVNR